MPPNSSSIQRCHLSRGTTTSEISPGSQYCARIATEMGIVYDWCLQKSYVGQTRSTLCKRFKQHAWTSGFTSINRAFKKYGKAPFKSYRGLFQNYNVSCNACSQTRTHAREHKETSALRAPRLHPEEGVSASCARLVDDSMQPITFQALPQGGVRAGVSIAQASGWGGGSELGLGRSAPPSG